MGQNWIIVNTSKKEYIDPTELEFGIVKLWEICAGDVCRVLPWLLAKKFPDPSGLLPWDKKKKKFISNPWAGRWAGDRIVLVGDSDEFYGEVLDTYREIGRKIVDDFNAFMGDKRLGSEDIWWSYLSEIKK